MLSVVTLFVIYPMLKKLHHNETDGADCQHTKAFIDTIVRPLLLSIMSTGVYVAEERRCR